MGPDTNKNVFDTPSEETVRFYTEGVQQSRRFTIKPPTTNVPDQGHYERHSEQGETIAEVKKVVYVRRKSAH
nr:hypothetical protein [Ardenticatena sp.]